MTPCLNATRSYAPDAQDPPLSRGRIEKIASVGANGMNDYPTYIATRGKAFAKTRRRLYKRRHEKDRHKKWTNGWLADKLLW